MTYVQRAELEIWHLCAGLAAGSHVPAAGECDDIRAMLSLALSQSPCQSWTERALVRHHMSARCLSTHCCAVYLVAEVPMSMLITPQRYDRSVCPAERVLTQERIKLLRLAMESDTVPPACYDVTSMHKRDKAVPAAPRWNTTHPPMAGQHDSVQYVLHSKPDRSQALHDGLDLLISRCGGLRVAAGQ